MNKFLKISFYCCGLAVTGASLHAVPAKPGIIALKQPDGSTIEVRIFGDENYSETRALDGTLLRKDGKGFYRKAEVDASGQKAAIQCSMKANIFDGSVPTTGELHGLVILAEFSDYGFQLENPKEKFTRQLNEEGYSDDGATGSVSDYYKDQSNGQFSPKFDVVGPVKLTEKMAYYGADNFSTKDPNVYNLIIDACKLADSQYGVNFADYDNNKDGKADLVYVVYAGYAQSNGASTNTIWPQSWALSKIGVELNLDNTAIDSYACSSELDGTSGSQISGIGLFCHEFSHTLGLPDIYATNETSSKLTMGTWDVMDYGCYNNGMRTPAGFSSYEKSVVGWLTPEELTESAKGVELPVLGEANKAYKLTSSKNPNEYYLLENRNKSNRWDKYLEGEGMLVIHVNYNEDVWNSNTVNNDPDNLGVHIIPANNDFSSESQGSSVVFPGTNQVKIFSDSTEPSATFSDGTLLGRPLTNISQKEDGTVTFDFNQKLPTPEITAPTKITETGFVANWNAVENAKYYSIVITDSETNESRTYDKIVRNRYTFSNLESGATYRYKVKAIGDVIESDYSEEATIVLSNAGISDVDADNTSAIYYNLQGIRVEHPENGIFIEVKDGKSRKVSIDQ